MSAHDIYLHWNPITVGWIHDPLYHRQEDPAQWQDTTSCFSTEWMDGWYENANGYMFEGFVYKWILMDDDYLTKNGSRPYYIGKHLGHPLDDYGGSGTKFAEVAGWWEESRTVPRSWLESGCWERRILYKGSKRMVQLLEALAISYSVSDPMCLNRNCPNTDAIDDVKHYAYNISYFRDKFVGRNPCTKYTLYNLLLWFEENKVFTKDSTDIHKIESLHNICPLLFKQLFSVYWIKYPKWL